MQNRPFMPTGGPSAHQTATTMVVPSLFSTAAKQFVERCPFNDLPRTLFPAEVIAKITATKAEMEFTVRYLSIGIHPSECQFLARSGVEDKTKTLEQAERKLKPPKLFEFYCVKGVFLKVYSCWLRCSEDEKRMLCHRGVFISLCALRCDARETRTPPIFADMANCMCNVARRYCWDEPAVRFFTVLNKAQQQEAILSQWMDMMGYKSPSVIYLKFQLLCKLLANFKQDLEDYYAKWFTVDRLVITVPERFHTPEYKKVARGHSLNRWRKRFSRDQDIPVCANKKRKVNKTVG